MRFRKCRTRALPDEGAASGWYSLLPPPPAARRLRSAQRADCAIVGAGFTGLAAAQRLAELRPAWRILLIEGQRVGSGTSGRNSGFVVDFANNSAWSEHRVRRKAARINRAGMTYLRSRVSELGLEEHWSEAGWLHAVSTDRSLPQLEAMTEMLDENGEPYERFDAASLERMLGTAHYRGALRLPGGAMVQPAALVRALAEHLPGNVEVYEESPAVAVAGGGKARVETPEGEVEAERLIIAAGGLSPTLGVLRRRVFPLITFAGMTRVLEPEERRALGGEPEWGLIALEVTGASLRRTRDHRLFVRNTKFYARDGRVRPAFMARAAEAHRRALRERFPQLGELELEFHWSGILGISRNRLPYFGRLDHNVFTAAAYSGAGISMGTIAGRLLAELAAGEDSDLLRDMLALPRPGWVPPEPLFAPIARFHLWQLEKRAVVKH